MKNRLLLISTAVIILAAGNVYAQQGNGKRNSENLNLSSIIESTAKEELSEEEKAGLLFLYEEEKLARDFYNSLYEKWGINIFKNIAASEQTHMDSVRYLLERYDVPVPKPENNSSFKNSDLVNLYSHLLEEGMKSYEDALKTGLLVEEKDIKDLMDEIKLSDNKDIRITYQNLMKGSRNHLRSFNRQLSRSGADYSPDFLSQSEYDRIKISEMERGGAITDPDFIY